MPTDQTKVQKNHKKPTHIVFPIWLLEGVDVDCVYDVAFKIFSFAVYRHSQKLSFGTPQRLIASASAHYGLQLSFNDRRLVDIRNTGEMLLTNYKHGYPFASIPVKKLVEVLEYETSEFDIVCFLAYAGLRSITGKLLFKQTSKKLLFSRMAGNAREIEVEALPVFLKKYFTRKKFEKIKFELKHNWGVEFYGLYTRGFYFSFNLKLNSLIEVVETNRKQLLINSDKQAQWEAREQALKKLSQGKNQSDQS